MKILWLLFCFVFLMLNWSILSFASTTTSPSSSCTSRNDSCESCLKDVGCLWCHNPQKCVAYPANTVLPTTSVCKLSDARWGVCWLNFEAMIISVSVIGGVLLIGITLCICKCCGCCCFKKKNQSRYQAEQMKLEHERQERSAKQSEKKQERQRRNDDIRRKYGLGGGGSQYQKFQNEEYDA